MKITSLTILHKCLEKCNTWQKARKTYFYVKRLLDLEQQRTCHFCKRYYHDINDECGGADCEKLGTWIFLDSDDDWKRAYKKWHSMS